ncbi:MAG TPA: hypothetical protein VGN97_07405 [Mesorhizobium sp.]|nr:hypothetical protein [Mesorhizobium sp.]
MDWAYAVERNREALKRVLSALVAMAGLAGGRPEVRPTLPRHLHRAVLRLLRPAEAAARRLVIMAARGLVLAPPRQRPRKPPPERQSKGGRPGAVTGIWMPPHLRSSAARPPRRAEKCALPLFDPLPRMLGPKRKAANGVPRVCVPDVSVPFPVPPKRQPKGFRALEPDDHIDALRLALRLQALGRALDDLPREARRFARWRARAAAGAGAQNENRDAAGAQNENRDAAGAREGQAARPAQARRVWPLKPGRPPGVGRRAGSARPLSGSRRAVHPVHDILSDTHALALQALERFDTS